MAAVFYVFGSLEPGAGFSFNKGLCLVVGHIQTSPDDDVVAVDPFLLDLEDGGNLRRYIFGNTHIWECAGD